MFLRKVEFLDKKWKFETDVIYYENATSNLCVFYRFQTKKSSPLKTITNVNKA